MIGRPVRVLIAAVRAALLAGVLAGMLMTAPASAGQLRGVGVHPQALDQNAWVIRQEFRLLQLAGANSVRFDVSWQSIQWSGPSADPRTLAWIDWVLRQAALHRLKVILDILGTPCWASSAPGLLLGPRCSRGWWTQRVSEYPPIDPQDYGRFAAFAAHRWRRFLAAIELWNEPNGRNFFISHNAARDYAALVKAAYPDVKAVARHLPVLMSLAGTDRKFLKQLYAYGVRGSYDGIAVHPYADPHLVGLRRFRAYELSQGDLAPLWVTEVGWPSNVVGLHDQADQVSSVLRQLAAMPYIAAAEIYDMRDAGTDPNNGEDHFGLLDFNMNPKPAWIAFVRTLRELASTAASRR